MNKPLIVLLSLLPLLSVAQDWKLLNEQRVYYFSRSDSNGVTNSIRFQSLDHYGDTTVFTLYDNYLTPLDTCNAVETEQDLSGEGSFFNLTYGYFENSDLCNYYPMNQGSIPGKEIVDNGKGDFVLIPGNRLIKTKSNVNDTWIYDSLLLVSATVISIEPGIYINATDSLKTIYLSSGDTIVISKNFGLIQFPVGNGAYYHSEGVQGTGVGYTFPSFEDVFYGYQVGDAFQLSYSSLGVGESNVYGESASRKFMITGIDSSNSDIRYITDICGSTTYFFDDLPEYVSTYQKLNYIFKPDSLFRDTYGYPGEITKLSMPIMSDIFPSENSNFLFGEDFNVIGYQDIYSNIRYGYPEDFNYMLNEFNYNLFINLADSLKLIWKGVAGYEDMREQTNLTVFSNVISEYQVGIADGFHENDYGMSFIEGIGLVNMGWWFFEEEHRIRLTGFRKNGVSYGYMDDCIVVGLKETSKPDININFYPNPFENDLTISNHDNRNYRLEVLDVVGRKILEVQIIQGENNISLKEFQGNAFILRFIADNEAYTKRVIRVNR